MKLSILAALALSSLASASPPSLQVLLTPASPDLEDPIDNINASFDINTPLEDIINASPFLSFHRDLVQISSISGNESAVGAFLTSYLESHDFTVIKQAVPSSSSSTTRYNIYAYPASSSSTTTTRRRRKRPSILLTSHIDTVPPFIPYSLSKTSTPSKEDEILISGRGTVDAKASVAALTHAALQTLQNDPTAPLALLFVVDEEVGGLGMRTFSQNTTFFNPTPTPYHTIIFGEPTDLALVAGHKGMIEFQIKATGHAAHSGYPWLGESALSAILPALTILDQLGDLPADQGGLPASPKYGRTTVNIGHVVAGVAANVVPATATADVAVRLAAGTPHEAREIIRRAVANATADNPHVVVDFSVHPGGYPPQDLDTDVPGFAVTTVNYGTDVPNLVVDVGVKRYLYGPGSIHVAHGDNEAITVGQLEEAVRGYRRLIDAAMNRA